MEPAVSDHTGPITNEALNGLELDRKLTLADLPTASALSTQLKSLQLDVSEWGKGVTKSVDKLYAEVTEHEAELEVWKGPNGEFQVLRVTHVLRAKVCSEKSKANGKFLFNTWQQFPDGRRRTRNGLLSEKLCIQEIPIEEHLIDVCERAVTEEEMQRLEASTFMITPDCPPPRHDSAYKCPLKVDNATLLEHTVQVESSPSYPGLLTKYHLYTVDITCSGLPGVDFNTLEYTHADREGKRNVKYVHAWVWLGWADIQRYLLESSRMLERKVKGSYPNPESLHRWLRQFDLDLDEWGGMKGHKRFRSVEDLHAELEREEAQLELWGRHDGVSLLVRVVHLLQLQVQSTDPALADKFLLHFWQQNKDCEVDSQGCRRVLVIDRMVGHKLSLQKKGLGEMAFRQAVVRAVDEQLSTVMDAFFTIDQFESSRTTVNRLTMEVAKKPTVIVEHMAFVDHRVNVEESPTYQGMQTMYHRYTCEVTVSGLPASDFTTINSKRAGGPWVNGWRWVSWHQCVDHLHVRMQALERTDADRKREIGQLIKELEEGAIGLAEASESVSAAHREGRDNAPSVLARDLNLFQGLNRQLESSHSRLSRLSHDGDKGLCATRFPPSMVATMAEDAIYDQENLQQMAVRRRTHKIASVDKRVSAENMTGKASTQEVKDMVRRQLWIPLGVASVLLLAALVLLLRAAVHEGDIATILVGALNLGLSSILLGYLLLMFRGKYALPTDEDKHHPSLGGVQQPMNCKGDGCCPELPSKRRLDI